MNLNQLRHFYTVICQGSFSKAAEALFVSQPAISKSVNELEGYLGMALVERASRGKELRLTEHGKVLFHYARSIFALEQAASNEMLARQKLQQGTLTIGLSPTIANYCSADIIAAFMQRYPEIVLDVVVESTHRLCEQLIDCQLDLALVEGGDIDSTIFTSTQWKMDPMVIVAKAPLHMDQLNEQTWLLRESGSMTRNMMNALLTSHGITPQRIIEVGSNEAIANYIKQGIGISLLPKVVIQDLLDLAQLTVITEQDSLYRELRWIRCHERPLSPAAQAFHQLLFQHQT